MALTFGGTSSISSNVNSYDVGRFCFVRPFDCFPHVSRNKSLCDESLERNEFPRVDECNTPMTKSHRCNAAIPSIRKPASKEITSDSVVPCETEDCFLQVQPMGTTVQLPKIHNVLPEVEFESLRSSAKSES